MNQFTLNTALEWMPFAWEELPAFVLGANRGAATPPPAYAALRVSVTPSRRERATAEEEPERWDGLS